jgi:hypothetical protein
MKIPSLRSRRESELIMELTALKREADSHRRAITDIEKSMTTIRKELERRKTPDGTPGPKNLRDAFKF